MDFLGSKNIKIEDWSIDLSINGGYNVLKRSMILNDKEKLCCCSISKQRTIFHTGHSNNYYLDIYIGKKENSIVRDFDVNNFKSFETLFEAVLYADLYLKELGVTCLKKINYNPNWESKMKIP